MKLLPACFSRLPRFPALGLSLALSAGGLWAQTGELIVVKETGPRDKRVNMVIIGDGYTTADKAKFKSQMQTIADAVVKDVPLWDYTDYFNIYGIFVASNQTGADNSAPGVVRDTYFGANYVNGSRLLIIDNSKGMAVINKYLPEADMQFAIVNSEVYGGSGGEIAVANYTSPEIIAHEVQHSFTGLGDEYDYPGVEPWEAPNTTKTTVRKDIRWTHWIAAATPVPTPETPAYEKLSGLFEGAAYNATGWYRPKQNCRMRENGIPFCEVCMEAVLLSLYDRVSPLDSALPKTALVTVAMNQVPPLHVITKKPIFHDLSLAWFVDGALQADVQGATFTKPLAAGLHRVTVKVSDTTHVVRKDPKGLLSDSASWQVSVTATTRLLATRPTAARGIRKGDAEADLNGRTLRHHARASLPPAGMGARRTENAP